MGLAHTNGQHHQHQLRIAVAPQSTGHHHEISLETPGPGTHERPASPASAANCFWPRNQQVIITRSAWKHLGLAHTNGQHHQHQLRIALAPHEISLETLGPGTHERPASPASAANCFWPRSQQVIITRSAWKHTNGQHHQHQLRIVITRSAWKHLGLAHTNGQHQLRIALAPQSTGHHNEISSETLGPGTHERPASPASAANCFGPAINRTSSRDQLGNTWAWHTRTAGITSISCELLLAPQSIGHHHEIRLETLGPGTHERPASPASAANCFGPAINRSSSRDQLGNTWAWHTRTASISCELLLAPQSTGHHHEISLETLGPGTHERPASPASAANCFGPAINRTSSRDQLGNTLAPKSTSQHNEHQH